MLQVVLSYRECVQGGIGLPVDLDCFSQHGNRAVVILLLYVFAAQHMKRIEIERKYLDCVSPVRPSLPFAARFSVAAQCIARIASALCLAPPGQKLLLA